MNMHALAHRAGQAAAVALLFTSLPALAGQSPSEAKLRACKSAATVAETIMRARQAGVPVVKLVDAIKAPEGPARADALRFVQEAYAQPAWNGPELQTKAITDFGAAKYVECMQATPG